MRPTTQQTRTFWWFAAIAVACLIGWQDFAAAGTDIPRPAALKSDVDFWIRVYTEITTNEGFLHDERNLDVVYEKMRFPADMSPAGRQKIVDEARDTHLAVMQRLIDLGDATLGDAAAVAGLDIAARRMLELWHGRATVAELKAARERVRFQLGQADRFRAGLVRSGAYETHIAETLANLGLPPEIAALPHVESSFNPDAYSKVGAAGLWQFMRSTGRRYMRVDDAVDERLDPYRSTEAAAQLLAYNYRVLGSWPLALTAYNHGAAGMRRAKQKMGTDDFVTIARNYQSRTFGFASRNFYPSFLAALSIDEDPRKYFGDIERAPEQKFTEVAVPGFVPAAALLRATGLDEQRLRALNPGLRDAVWRGSRLVPRDYRLRLPAEGGPWTTAMLAEKLFPQELFANQVQSRYHKVRRGDTLGIIARKYGTSVAELADLNDISRRAILRRGALLKLPEREPVLLAKAAATPVATTSRAASAVAAALPRAGASGAETAASAVSSVVPSGKATPKGQGSAAGTTATELPPAEPWLRGGPLTRTAPAASIARLRRERDGEAAGGEIPEIEITVARAAADTVREAKAVAREAEVARDAQPVSAGQAAELGPSVGPPTETPQSVDLMDLAVDEDDSVRVYGEETLGHYAEWLETTAAQLRRINQLRYGQPLLLGRRIKLDFARVTRGVFEERRRDYHSRLQARFFNDYRIAGTEIYIVRRGDSLWTLTQKFGYLPAWLLQQYNPDIDLGALRAGMQLVIPKTVATGSADA
ncbi:MAG: transglycosylase SLT domain-containing protein [Steroidobacteraceae bacterium]